MKLVKRSFSLAGHRTSVALEAVFWDALSHIAAQAGTSLSMLVTDTDRHRDPAQNLASALRVLALRDAQAKAQAAAHVTTGVAYRG